LNNLAKTLLGRVHEALFKYKTAEQHDLEELKVR
jgi:hypothetical protein